MSEDLKKALLELGSRFFYFCVSLVTFVAIIWLSQKTEPFFTASKTIPYLLQTIALAFFIAAFVIVCKMAVTTGKICRALFPKNKTPA